MKTASPLRSIASNVQDTGTIHAPIRVCMHVLGVARTDVRVMREATALVEAGFAVTVVDVEGSQHPNGVHGQYRPPARETIHGINLKHIVSPAWYIPTRFKPWFLVKLVLMILRGAFQLLRTPADIYHAHDDISLPACYIAARLRRKPLIFDAHELPLTETSVTRWKRLSALAAGLLTYMMWRCAGVITVSAPIAQEIQKQFHGQRRPDQHGQEERRRPGQHGRLLSITLVRNMPAYKVVVHNDQLRQALGLSSEVRVVLYQGALQANRGLGTLIRAAPFLKPDTVIVLMGAGSKALLSELRVLIGEEGATERVKLLPAVPYAELLSWSASADLGLIVYNPEHSLNVRMCLPNKLFEYLMAGLPILASQLDAVGDVINTYQVGQIVPSLAPQDIAAAISTMLADHSALAQMRHNALELARKEFCWEKEAPSLIDLYHNVLAPSQEDLSC